MGIRDAIQKKLKTLRGEQEKFAGWAERQYGEYGAQIRVLESLLLSMDGMDDEDSDQHVETVENDHRGKTR
jgi:hypothetical protein